MLLEVLGSLLGHLLDFLEFLTLESTKRTHDTNAVDSCTDSHLTIKLINEVRTNEIWPQSSSDEVITGRCTCGSSICEHQLPITQ